MYAIRSYYVWTEHAQMNIEPKKLFYGEIRRVLKRGGSFAFHDVFAGTGGDVHLPVPWASDPSISVITSYSIHYTKLYEKRGGWNGTVLGTASGALPVAAWSYVEVKMTIHDTAGAVEVRVSYNFV